MGCLHSTKNISSPARVSMQLFQSRAIQLQNCSEICRGKFCSVLHSHSSEPLRFFTRQMEREPKKLQRTPEGKESNNMRSCIFWEVLLTWRVIRHSLVVFMSFFLSPRDQKGLKNSCDIGLCSHWIYTHHISIGFWGGGGGLHMSLAITQTFIIIVTIWLMGPNKPLLTWTLCAQIPRSLCFFPCLSGCTMPSSCNLVTLKCRF